MIRIIEYNYCEKQQIKIYKIIFNHRKIQMEKNEKLLCKEKKSNKTDEKKLFKK